MNQPINDGGSAFPYKRQIRCNGEVIDYVMESGMTLRDYYIVHAPAAEIAEMVPATIKDCAFYIGVPCDRYDGVRDYVTVLAKARCAWADAMLKAREAK